MALYHCSIKSGSKGNGASGKAKADYISREGKYADKPDLEYKESGNMPEWAQKDPRTFWKASDQNERANGRVWTEIEISLPRESSESDRKELVQGFIKEQLKDHPYTVAIHNPKALDGEEQPHAHIIFSERKLDGINRGKAQFFKRANAKEPAKGGTAKDRAWNDRDKVQVVREAWERHYNKAVSFQELQVSCKSLKAQGIDRDPEPKLGPKGIHSPAADRVKETRKNRDDLQTINRQIRDLSREIETAKVEQVQPVQVQKSNPVIAKSDVQPVRAVMTNGNAQSEALPPLPEKNKLPPQQPASKPLAVDPSVEFGVAGEPSFELGVVRSRLTQIDEQADQISRKHQPTPEEREAHKAAYMKPFTDRKLAYNQSVNGFNRDFKAWQEKGKTDGWMYKEPLRADASWLDKKIRAGAEAMQSKEERAWQVQGNRLDHRRDEIVTEKQNCERFKGQREEDYRTRGTQELFIATRKKIEAVPEYQKLQTEKNAINAAIREHKKAIEKTLDKDRGMSRGR